MPSSNPFSNLLVTLTLSDRSLSKLRSAFKSVTYLPPATCSSPSREVLDNTDILFGSLTHLPSIKSLDELPKLGHIQLGSAGADSALRTEPLQEYMARIKPRSGSERNVTMSTASGTHVVSIPNWVVGSVIVLYHQIHRMLAIARVSWLSSLLNCLLAQFFITSPQPISLSYPSHYHNGALIHPTKPILG